MAKAPPVAPNANPAPNQVAAAPQAPVAANPAPQAQVANTTDPNVPQAPVADAAAADTTKHKRGRAALPRHPALWDAAADEGKGKALKIDAVPVDYDAGKFAPLRETDFNDAGTFFEYQATVYDKKALKMREMAKQSRTIGALVSRKEANKLTKMQNKFMEMIDTLVKAQPEAKQAQFRADILAQMTAQKAAADAANPQPANAPETAAAQSA